MKKDVKNEINKDKTTDNTKRLVKNNAEICKDVYKALEHKYTQQTITEIINATDSVVKDAIIKGVEVKKPGLFFVKIKHVKGRKFLSINSKLDKDGKPQYSVSKPHLRASFKVSKEIQKALNGEIVTKKKVKKAVTKTAKSTTTTKTASKAKKK